MRKPIIITIIFIALLSSISLMAQDSGFGLGVILGEPTGISFKGWLNNKTALDCGIAWSFTKNESFHFHADYLFHNFNVFKSNKGKSSLYYGIGGRVKTTTKSRIGVRIPVGFCYLFKETPLDIFIELAPLMDLSPRTQLWFTGGVGIRYYF